MAEQPKRPRPSSRQSNASSSLLSDLSRHLLCPLSEELMVDPVLAEDGYTYERSELLHWLATHGGASPMNPNLTLDAERLMSNVMAKQQVTELIASGELDDATCAAFSDRKSEMLRQCRWIEVVFKVGGTREGRACCMREREREVMKKRCFV